MSRDIILAIDNGTQSVRALLFDPQGTLLDRVQVHVEPYVSPNPGWAEQDTEVYWEALCQACQKLWAQTDIPRDALAGVALTTMRGTVVNIDAAGKVLRPAIIWLDQRRAQVRGRIKGPWGLLFSLLGLQETAAYVQAEAEANWIAQNEPDIWGRTDKYVFLSGWLTMKLTGRIADSIGCQAGYVPFDYKAQEWSKPNDWKWQAVHSLQREMLPDLVPPTETLGTITPQASEATGIPAGLPLIAAAGDKACEIIGSGALTPEIACLSYGTTASVSTTFDNYMEVIPLIPPFPAAVPGAYSPEITVYRGFWMVRWFKQEFGLMERIMAEEHGVEVEALFDEMVHSVAPGSMGLVLQPFWSPGIRYPGPEAKGAIIGWGDVHTRAHLYRAIIEGLAYALREGKERIEKRGKVRMRELRIAGGGSQSDAAMQIAADVFGMPASRPHTYEASGLGAAIDAAVGLGLHTDFPTAVAAMTRTGRTFEPVPENHALYEGLYHGVYRKMYDSLRPLYESIRRVTDYPPRLLP
ncbi:MAG: carbohydrate kinase [Chloroflexi bacterium]|nr:carbohydrate kinase [Chloroflexota bacterium]